MRPTPDSGCGLPGIDGIHDASPIHSGRDADRRRAGIRPKIAKIAQRVVRSA